MEKKKGGEEDEDREIKLGNFRKGEEIAFLLGMERQRTFFLNKNKLDGNRKKI
jgi:hypothetical protein